MNIYYFYNKKQDSGSWKEEVGGGEREAGDKKGGDLPQDLPIVHRLGEPAEDGVPVCQIGFLLGHVLLTVAQHLGQQTHEPICLLL